MFIPKMSEFGLFLMGYETNTLPDGCFLGLISGVVPIDGVSIGRRKT